MERDETSLSKLWRADMTERIHMEELKKNMTLFIEEVEQIERADLDDQSWSQHVSSTILQAFQIILQAIHVPNPTSTATLSCPHINTCGRPVTVTLMVGSARVCPKCNNAIDISLT